MAEGRQDELRVRVPIDEELDALRVADLSDKVVEAGILWGIARHDATVSLGALVWRGTSRISIPVRLPVPVDVSSETCLIWSVGWWRLTVLSPETLVCLGVNEA